MISDHYRDKWFTAPLGQGIYISYEDWKEYQELKRKAQEYDNRFNQPDCVKPELQEWEQKMREFLIKQGVIEG
jgi:hypothetical protein